MAATKDWVADIIDTLAAKLADAFPNAEVLKKFRREEAEYRFPNITIVNPDFEREPATLGKYRYRLEIPVIVMDKSFSDEIDLPAFRDFVFDVVDVINAQEATQLDGKVETIRVLRGGTDLAVVEAAGGAVLYYGLMVEVTKTVIE
jgi:hypothetical protein